MSNQVKNMKNIKLKLTSNRGKVFVISTIAILLSLFGFIFSFLNPSIKAPLRPGLDFTGGTQIKLERYCEESECSQLNSSFIIEQLTSEQYQDNSTTSPKIVNNVRLQFLDGYKSLVIRLPFISASQSELIINKLDLIAGPFEKGGQSIDTIGPTLGKQLLKNSLISLAAAFAGIAIYISFRFDKKYAFLALLALFHDVFIVCGLFSWLGIIYQVEIDSLFAVALLTIAGYSVNDTVVVFDRIRELNSQNDLSHKNQIDIAVSATLTRTLYTSGSTLLPLLSLIFLGGDTLYWFAIALSFGVIVGSWSSIALAPALLSLLSLSKSADN